MTDHTTEYEHDGPGRGPGGKLIPFRDRTDDGNAARATDPDLAADDGEVSGPVAPVPDRSADVVPDDHVRVLVDPPAGPERGDFATAIRTRSADLRPIVPAWLRDRAELRDTTRWAARYTGHKFVYHLVRLPKYLLRLAWRSPRGAARVLARTGAWVNDAEARPLRLVAVTRQDPETYMRLLRERDRRVRARTILAAAAAAVGLPALAVITVVVPEHLLWLLGGLVVTGLGLIGSPADTPLLDTAVTVHRAPRLTSQTVERGLRSVGIAEINKAKRIEFPNPIQRDGPGWRADVDLPYGVTATDILERRDKLASGLRRPMGCVWPEPAYDQHAGRLVLWVGDQDMNQVKPKPWPLGRTGQADVFKALPFGTDQRGRRVAITLMFNNVLIGAMPRQGKTFALRVLALGTSLDPTVQQRVFELKGTGDLSALEKTAHHYGSGADDETIAACVASLREVHKDLERRAKKLSGLPKHVVPENKVTPQVAAKTTLGLFPMVFIIDECQELFSHPQFGKEAGELATAIIKRGPAMGVMLVLATQRPDKDSLPTGISANVGIRFCLRVMGQVENDMVLGTSMYRNGVRATTFTQRDKGIGYLVGVADDPQIARGDYIDGPEADRIGDRARALREAAGTLTGYAAGDQTGPGDARVSLIDDVAAVIAPAEEKVWSETVVARLAELRPDLYRDWTPVQLADALRPYGVATVQVWGQTQSGDSANRRGLVREDVLAATERAHP